MMMIAFTWDLFTINNDEIFPWDILDPWLGHVFRVAVLLWKRIFIITIWNQDLVSGAELIMLCLVSLFVEKHETELNEKCDKYIYIKLRCADNVTLQWKVI